MNFKSKTAAMDRHYALFNKKKVSYPTNMRIEHAEMVCED